MPKSSPGSDRLKISLATEQDRQTIYRLRHEVYASELAQHAENPAEMLSDSLDDFNIYITASFGDTIAGFISITPPNQRSYSIDKYFARAELPLAFDEQLYEIRILTVLKAYRGRTVAGLLMYAALHWVEAQGGRTIVALGRREVLDIYRKVGLRPLGFLVQAGAVTFEVLSATTAEIREHLTRYTTILHRLKHQIDWQLDIPFDQPVACFHGGAFFEAIGPEFDRLERSRDIINADVLDAWYPPSPKVLATLREYLPWLLRTSPPDDCRGMVKTVARLRGVPPDCILPGAGSSDLIYLALRQWFKPGSRALILDPTYGEYAHVLENVIGGRVDRLLLARDDGYRLDLAQLEAHFEAAYDLIVLINPNSPTGCHVPRRQLELVLRRAPASTLIWLDETYVEYAGPDQSLETFAARSRNVIVCKSMSKVYALSGVRAAYLCGPPALIAELTALTPPWAVSLPAQIAAVKALQDPDYYAARYEETHVLRVQLAEALQAMTPLEVVPGVANFLLCHLPSEGPDAATIVQNCRASGLFLRDVTSMGSQLGQHTVRIAVKDNATNRQIVTTLASIWQEETAGAVTASNA
jgi:histidinol-phosphate/aromatic aminotransferase/cobyric acid decarboxylase-like protein/GNAT superfamily N-acetyltransferase